MILVIPISSSDAYTIHSFSEVLKLTGPYYSHQLLLVSKESNKEIVNIIKNEISDYFADVMNLFIKDEDCPIGWPQGPNFYWKETIIFLKKIGNTLPWYWMEPDVVPMKVGWIDNIEEIYIESGASFMGSIANPNFDYPAHLSGCAVYPADISLYTNYWKWIHNTNIAFDIVCGSINRVISNTYSNSRMVNFFRTRNYKIINGTEFTFDKMPMGFNLGREADFENQKIDSNTIVVHGCKDSSLASIVIDKLSINY